MIWAINTETSQRIRAVPKTSAACPMCQVRMIPKCGEIVTWHWAHHTLRDCDPWWEPESQWHIEWKECFPPEWQEVIVKPHRADVKTPDGRVIEFQASPISPEEIRERENFYGSMVWILRGEDFEDWFDIRESSRYAKRRCLQCGLKQGWPMRESAAYVHGNSCASCGGDLERLETFERPYWTFRWKHPRRSWGAAQRPVGVDFDGMIFWIRKLYLYEHCAGWGVYQSHKDFINSF